MSVVSVIIPVYNVESYMDRCARSLFGQTLGDIEYIFIDDCTPDHSIEIMQEVLVEYPQRKEQVRVYRMPRNSGQAKVRIQGMSMATGEYVIHCDSDDELDTDAFRQLYEKAVAEDLDIVSCDFVRIYPNGDRKYYSQVSRPGEELNDVLFNRVWGTLCCRLIRRSVLEEITPPIGNLCEDVMISCQAICRSKRFGYVESALYHYFVRESSTIFSFHLDEVRKGVLANAQLLTDLLQNSYHYAEKTPAIVFFKYRNRDYLLPKVRDKAYYKLWRNTFPEIDRYFLFIPHIPSGDKLSFVLIHLHLYHPWKKVTHSIKEWRTRH